MPTHPVTILHLATAFPGPDGKAIGGMQLVAVRDTSAHSEPLLVGTATLHVDADGVAGLYDLFVLGSDRRHGVGSRLVRTACHEARRAGCTDVLVSAATPRLVRFYQRLGFAPVDPGEEPTADKVLHLDISAQTDASAHVG